MLTKAQRLQLFMEALTSASPATTHDAAYTLIATRLNAVEDAHSGVPDNPDTWDSDGRIYPPQPDHAQPSSEYTGVIIYRSKRHLTLIAPNGAFEIRTARKDEVLFRKLGDDGRDLESFRSPPTD